MAFPGLLLLLTIMSVAGQGLPQIIVVLGIAGGVGGSRVVRGAVVATKGNDFFLAARAVGSPTRQVLVRHVLPNIVAPLIIVFSINVGGVILAEASLSFLGFGLPIKVPSWGGMLSREGRRFMEQGAVAGAVARAVPDDRGVQFQHVGRCDARPARPAPARQRRPSRRRRRQIGPRSDPKRGVERGNSVETHRWRALGCAASPRSAWCPVGQWPPSAPATDIGP